MTGLSGRAGIHEQVWPRHNARYTMAIPDGYTGAEAVPLVVALHWGGVVTPFYGKYILVGLVEPALRELGALVVAPDCLHGDWTNPQSESEIIELFEYLQDNYTIDPNRTAITGYSIGGRGTWYLAARNQDKFTAAMPMAGHPQPDSADVKWEIPLYVIHGRRDEIFPFEQTEGVVRRLKDRGLAVEFVSLKEATHFETERFVQPLKAAVPWLRKVWAGK